MIWGPATSCCPRLPHDLWLEDPQGRVKALLLEFLAGLD